MRTLSEAAREGNVELCKELIAQGADINSPDDWPPIHDACILGHVAVARLLIEQGAQLDLGLTNHVIAAADRGDVVMTKLFIDAGCSVDSTCSRGKTGLMYAAGNDDAVMVRFFIESSADVNRIDSTGNTCLTLAIDRDSLEAMKVLINAGVELSGAGAPEGAPTWTAFQRAVLAKAVNVMRYFLFERGEDPVQRCVDGRTMLQLAGDSVDAAEILRAAITARTIDAALVCDPLSSGSDGSSRKSIAPSL